MGITPSASSSQNNEEKIRDRKIQRALVKAHEKDELVLKILLLGAGEAGKTTIFKQLCLTKGDGIPEVTRREQKRFLFGNIIDGMCSIIEGGDAIGLKLSSTPDISAFVQILQTEVAKFQKKADITRPVTYQLDDQLVKCLLVLWDHPLVKQAYEECYHNGKFYIPDTFKKLMDRLKGYPKWGKGDKWLPSDTDVLLVRQRTTGLAEQDFTEANMTFRLIDVGGQKSERNKWLHQFEKVTAVIYVASLSEYDQTLFEQSDTNRLQDSIALFKTTAENPFLRKSAFILFMNKFDLFVEKYYVKHIPLNFAGIELFEDAPSVDEETDANCKVALGWFKGKLLETIDEKKRNTFYVHYTTAIDTQKMAIVIDLVAKHVLETHLKAYGFLADIGPDNS